MTARGVYTVLAQLNKKQQIQIGKKRKFTFEKGVYAYVGSALNGLESRLARHLRSNKKLHWHIDYLLNKAKIEAIIFAETSQKKECLIAQALEHRLPSITGFGCSDCRCGSHLFFGQDLEALNRCVFDSFKLVKLKPQKINYY
jgi:Uri superfamily endonuclease